MLMLKETYGKAQTMDYVSPDGEKGAGTGLILVKDFIINNGGKLTIESEEGKGSNFTFTIPLA